MTAVQGSKGSERLAASDEFGILGRASPAEASQRSQTSTYSNSSALSPMDK